MTTESKKNSLCCPKFDPAPWDDKLFEWENKKFIKERVFTLFYMPVNFGSVMKKIDKKATEAGAIMSDWLVLSDHTSMWNMDIYLGVAHEIAGAENHTLNGKFYSKVYEGSFQQTGKWCEDFKSIAKAKDLTIKKLYMWYTTCPKCAKQYGKNYVAIIASVE